MVRFKVVKFKHYRQAQALIAKEDATEAEHFAFVISLVEEWDFVDAETKEPLPAELASMDELSIDQFNEAMELFNEKMFSVGKVKKTSAAPSSSTSSLSSKEESLGEISPAG